MRMTQATSHAQAQSQQIGQRIIDLSNLPTDYLSNRTEIDKLLKKIPNNNNVSTEDLAIYLSDLTDGQLSTYDFERQVTKQGMILYFNRKIDDIIQQMIQENNVKESRERMKKEAEENTKKRIEDDTNQQKMNIQQDKAHLRQQFIDYNKLFSKYKKISMIKDEIENSVDMKKRNFSTFIRRIVHLEYPIKWNATLKKLNTKIIC